MLSDSQKQAIREAALEFLRADQPAAGNGQGRIRVPCCFHSGKKTNLVIDLVDGLFHCHVCGIGGDAIDYFRARTGKSFKDAVEALIGCTARVAVYKPHPHPKTQTINPYRKHLIDQVWCESVPPLPDDRYLTITRALSLTVMPHDLRYHPGLVYFDPETGENKGEYPAMVAAIRNPASEIVSVHRTFLTPDGEKAFGPASKKIMASPISGITKGGAIRLYPAGEVLGVTEGIETAIACQNQTGIPVWACVSAGGLETVVIPPEVREIVIFADNDASNRGQTAAIKLATRLVCEGKTVKILAPSQLGTDWADIKQKETQDNEQYKPFIPPQSSSGG